MSLQTERVACADLLDVLDKLAGFYPLVIPVEFMEGVDYLVGPAPQLRATVLRATKFDVIWRGEPLPKKPVVNKRRTR